MNCGDEDIDKHLVIMYNKFVGIEQPEVNPVKHAMVDKQYHL